MTSKDLQQSKEAGNFFAQVLMSWLQEKEEVDWELAHANGKPFAWAFPEYSAKLLTALPTEGQEAMSTLDAVDAAPCPSVGKAVSNFAEYSGKAHANGFPSAWRSSQSTSSVSGSQDKRT